MRPETPKAEVDVWERTKPHTGGEPQAMDRRLFMQLLVFDAGHEPGTDDVVRGLSAALTEQGAQAVLYEDVNNPTGLALLSWSCDPTDFVTRVRPALRDPSARNLVQRHQQTMFGRTYATGYEPDLEFWLVGRAEQTVLNPLWPWAIWYPLRRSGEFARLDPKEKSSILREHAEIGKAYGASDLAHDVRLACHGLDANDNEFVIGLIGKALHPLSHVIERMRSTRQTSQYINQMGPFFVGHAIWRSSPGGN